MVPSAPLHTENFRENEKTWNDKAELPIAVFIGLSPPGTYFRCFVRHNEEIDCSKLSKSANSFANSIIDVVSSSGIEITGISKKDKVESLSRNFCVVDFFESVSEMRKALKRFRRGEGVGKAVEPSVLAVSHIAKRCNEHGQKLRVIAALGHCVDPAENQEEGRGKWGFRWTLWNSLQKSVEQELGEGVAFKRWDNAHLFGDSEAKARWMSQGSVVLREVARERTSG